MDFEGLTTFNDGRILQCLKSVKKHLSLLVLSIAARFIPTLTCDNSKIATCAKPQLMTKLHLQPLLHTSTSLSVPLVGPRLVSMSLH